MAKFADTGAFAPIPTALKGIYVSVRINRSFWKALEEKDNACKTEEDGIELLLDLCQNVICDHEGGKFEDLQTREQVVDLCEEAPYTPKRTLVAVMDAIGSEVGKSGATPTPS